MATPQQFVIDDPTRGMSLAATRDPHVDKTRYLFNPGQFLDPSRVQQLAHLKRAGGGEEVQAHCIRRGHPGFLPRAQLTALEVWTEALPRELLAEGAETVVITGGDIPAGVGNRRPGQLIGRPLSHVKFYPGDELTAILRANEGKGIVEIKALFDKPWWEDETEAINAGRLPTKPGLPQRLNRDFFPSEPPIELRLVEQRIAEVGQKSEVHAAVANEMLDACTQFRRWAEIVVAAEHTLLRQRVSHLHTYTYSPVARELLRQLEMRPQDTLFEQQMGGITSEQLQAIIGSVNTQGTSPELIGQIAGEVARQMMAAQAETKKGRKPAEKEEGANS